MAAVVPKKEKIREFPDQASFEKWLAAHHDSEDELWLKLHKKGSGLKSVTIQEALDVALCWGWIDAIRKSFDDKSYLQRYVPRGKKSVWSQINRDHIERLIKEGRMQPAGLKQVEAAKADGRWDRAYASAKTMEIPDDLLAAIEAEPEAMELFQRLSSQNRYALAFRLHHMKTEAGRKKKIESFVKMLQQGETIHPNGAVDKKAR